jgi:hypothetical protein
MAKKSKPKKLKKVPRSTKEFSGIRVQLDFTISFDSDQKVNSLPHLDDVNDLILNGIVASAFFAEGKEGYIEPGAILNMRLIK